MSRLNTPTTIDAAMKNK